MRVVGQRWWAVALMLVLACWAGWWIPLNNDVSWQYWVARQMRGGATLYRDIVEVNPPLWFWEAVPLSGMAAWMHIDASHLAIVSVMVRVTLALLLVARLMDDQPPRQIGLLLAGLAFLLCILPLHDFAEREHLMLMGAIPYTALIARRRENSCPISSWLASLVGLYGAYGFALKPYFALVPLALELWLLLGLRRSWRLLRAETVALVLVAVIYAAVVILFAPDYLHLILPLAIVAYGAFSPPFWWLLVQFWMPACMLALVALATVHRALPLQARAAVITALALAASYFLQGKGFSYQALPVAATLCWALWLFLVRNGNLFPTLVGRPLTALALLAFVLTCALTGTFNAVTAGRATEALRRLPPGSVVAVISAHSWLAFPLVEDQRFVWSMRGLHLWTIPKIARDGEGLTATAQGLDLRRQTLDTIATDLWCHPPDAILFDNPERSPALRGMHFSYEAFIRSDPRITSLLANYRPSAEQDGVVVYARQDPIMPRGNDCRSISIRPDFR